MDFRKSAGVRVPAGGAAAGGAAAASAMVLRKKMEVGLDPIYSFHMPPPYTALVFGGTGATGSAVVAALGARPDVWKEVIVPVRGDALPSTSSTSIRYLPHTSYSALPALGPADAAFICLGTTRAVCGSAAAFLEADLAAPQAAAVAAVAAGAAHVALVSAAGAARGGAWAPHAALLHPLLYRATKGAAEEAVLAAGAPSTSIYRPGLLARGAAHTGGRAAERWAAALLPALPVADLAAAMVAGAEGALLQRDGAGYGEVVVGDKEIRAAVAAAAAAVAGVVK
jgi:nucleoside-diphosphate-sugar epimerase